MQWRVGKRRKSRGFSNFDLAETFLRRVTAEVERAGAGEPRDTSIAPPLGKLVPPWLEARKATHRAADKDRSRWKNHLEPAFARLRPDEVDAGELRRFILDRLTAGLAPGAVRLCIRLLSTLYSDLIDDGHAVINPVAALPKKTRRLYRSGHDPRTTPFVERQEDIGRIFNALPEPVNVAYALGALAGLRTGEILALRWASVDIGRRRIVVKESLKGPTKSGRSRVAPILDALAPILQRWSDRAVTHAGRVIPPCRARAAHFDPHTMGDAFSAGVEPLGLPALTWYQATRHTFASHWVMAGGSLDHLREILGHKSVTTTERYAHLKPEMFGVEAHARLAPIVTNLAPRALRGMKGKVLGPVQN